MDVMVVVRAFILRNGRILFVQRALNDRNNPGKWEVPGGKVERGELPLAALGREVRQEVGLGITPISPTLMGKTYHMVCDSRYAGMLYLPLYTVFEAVGAVELGDEHTNFQWLTWEEATRFPNLTGATAHMLTVMEPWLNH